MAVPHRAGPSSTRGARGAADALLGALVALTVEAFVVTLSHRAEIAGAWEVRAAFRALVPVAWLAVVPLALFGGTLIAFLRHGDRPRERRVLVGAAAIFAALVGTGVTTGRHFRATPIRAGAVVVFVVVAAAVAWAMAPVIARWRRAHATLFASSAAALTLGLTLINVVALPRLYPAFHAGLSALTLLAATAAAGLWAMPAAAPVGSASPFAARLSRWAYAGGVFSVLGLAAALVPHFATTLAPAENVRFVYGTAGPTLRYGAELAAVLHPPQAAESAAASPTQIGQGESGVDFRGRDLVVISIDALRADHVGAYGYERAVTPNIDALAREGARFEYAYCATPHTSYSVASMMTGKYMRPLLLQGAAHDSDTWARLLRTYGYRSAAFYPPAVFFIDEERFTELRDRGLDFEYRRVEFAPAALRATQVATYLEKVREGRRVFVWVHLFEPHEPYEAHAGFALGDRDIERYDGEIAAADDGVGKIVAAVRAKRPGAVIVVTADHGEEFGEHGGRYHGTSVYEEQVRVPLVIVAPGIIAPRVVREPVQTIDLLPTSLAALGIPRPARLRGRDLGSLLGPRPPEPGPGFAFSETDEGTMLAERTLRLVCARKIAACQLFDVAPDAAERRDVSSTDAQQFSSMRARLRQLEASHGTYELAGLRAEGLAWPEALRRGIAGDADAALDVAGLLDDADVSFRRKAAEVLFNLRRQEAAPALRVAAARDDDDIVRRWASLSLARLGEGAARAFELVDDPDVTWRRLAALALAENGDARGEDTLVRWFQTGELSFERKLELVHALGTIRASQAVVPLSRVLGDLRLRPAIAEALAAIDEPAARGPLLAAFSTERYVQSRLALGRALVKLGAGAEIAPALARFLGTPDPLPDGLALGEKAKILESLGGPGEKDLPSLRHRGPAAKVFRVYVPRTGRGDGRARLLVRARVFGQSEGVVHVGIPTPPTSLREGPDAGKLVEGSLLTMTLRPDEAPRDYAIEVPATFGAAAGRSLHIALQWSENVELTAFALVPLADELPPPPPAPWKPSAADQSEEVVDDGT